MSKTRISAAAFADTKPHYELLDGLRGVAALLVVFYHIFEGLSFAAGGTLITTINHGYLAVDFFFILSGFVIGYAYDDRLGKTMSLGNFFKRRLIRLHPMIVMGAVIGAVTFCIQGSVQWDGTKIATSMVMLALLCAMFFIPAVPGVRYEVRGNGEMFPLNGPSWSLFFEYIGNILYALFIHRLSKKALVAILRIHRKYIIRVIHSSVIQEGSGRTRRHIGRLPSVVCHVRCLRLRHDRRGLDTRQRELLGRITADAFPLHDGNAAITPLPTDADTRRILDLFVCPAPSLLCALHRKQRTD